MIGFLRRENLMAALCMAALFIIYVHMAHVPFDREITIHDISRERGSINDFAVAKEAVSQSLTTSHQDGLLKLEEQVLEIIPPGASETTLAASIDSEDYPSSSEHDETGTTISAEVAGSKNKSALTEPATSTTSIEAESENGLLLNTTATTPIEPPPKTDLEVELEIAQLVEKAQAEELVAVRKNAEVAKEEMRVLKEQHRALVEAQQLNDITLNSTSPPLEPSEATVEAATKASTKADEAVKISEEATERTRHEREHAERKVQLEQQHAEMDAVLATDLPGLPWFDSSKAAVVMEDRVLPNLIPLLLHFSNLLGPEWPIIWFTGPDWDQYHSTPFRRAIREKRIIIKAMPKLKFSNRNAVSEFLVKDWVWRHLAPAEHILMFQADSILCTKSDQSIEDFLLYDLVGAPIAEQYGQGYNGGLSLRSRTKVLEVIDKYDYKADQMRLAGEGQNDGIFEDQWFYSKMKDLPMHEDGSPGAKLPDRDRAMRFAVETIDYETPLGYHQPERWQSHNKEQLQRWCPEVRMIYDIPVIASR